MFAKETYMQRRALLKKNLGSGVLLFLGNDECGLNYEDNTFRYRQDSTFLYYFGLSCAGLSAIIDIDEDKEIIFGDELSIDAIVWMWLAAYVTRKMRTCRHQGNDGFHRYRRLSAQMRPEWKSNSLSSSLPPRT